MKFKFVLLLALLCANATAKQPTTAASIPATQPVFLVAPADQPVHEVQIDVPKMAPEKKPAPRYTGPIRVWSGPVPLSGILFLLVASMPVLASLYFAYQLFLFIQAHRRRLTLRHSRDE